MLSNSEKKIKSSDHFPLRGILEYIDDFLFIAFECSDISPKLHSQIFK